MAHHPQCKPLKNGRLSHTIHALRPKKKGDPEDHPEPVRLTENETATEEEELWIACRNCHLRLTLPIEQLAVNGSHLQTFANPRGVVFDIGCYRSAQGLAMTGPPSSDFTWFAGHTWQIVICSSCQTHLGWIFKGKSDGTFFGLIKDRLTEISTD